MKKYNNKFELFSNIPVTPFQAAVNQYIKSEPVVKAKELLKAEYKQLSNLNQNTESYSILKIASYLSFITEIDDESEISYFIEEKAPEVTIEKTPFYEFCNGQKVITIVNDYRNYPKIEKYIGKNGENNIEITIQSGNYASEATLDFLNQIDENGECHTRLNFFYQEDGNINQKVELYHDYQLGIRGGREIGASQLTYNSEAADYLFINLDTDEIFTSYDVKNLFED